MHQKNRSDKVNFLILLKARAKAEAVTMERESAWKKAKARKKDDIARISDEAR